jgi:hypothetical protein
VAVAHALTPLPDSSAKFFIGEWSGSGANGAYCYLTLNADGRGLVLIDGGSGDWLGARIKWHNRQQSVVVDTITPLPTSNRLRVMPLQNFTLSTGFNQSLTVKWSSRAESCNLQKIETTASHLNRARNVMNELPTAQGGQ